MSSIQTVLIKGRIQCAKCLPISLLWKSVSSSTRTKSLPLRVANKGSCSTLSPIQRAKLILKRKILKFSNCIQWGSKNPTILNPEFFYNVGPPKESIFLTTFFYLLFFMTSQRKLYLVETCWTIWKRATRTWDTSVETTQMVGL